MSTYRARIEWTREGDYASGRYSRAHALVFDGLSVPGSAAAGNVPSGCAVEAAVDPEEMFIASLSSCHMLWFLDVARRAGLVIDRYEDDADGVLEPGADGRMQMTRVTLRPKVTVSAGDAGALPGLHHKAHERCFIANSVTTKVRVEPVLQTSRS